MIHSSYFEILGVDETFHFDADALKKAYYKVSRQYHPDFFVNESQAEQLRATQTSELINVAYKTLSDHRLRTRYILQRAGLLVEGQKEEIDQSFLIEMMDINEAIFEAQSSDTAGELWETVNQQILQFEVELAEVAKTSMTAYDHGIDRQTHLAQIKEYYLKSRYLDRMKENIAGQSAI